MYGGNGVRRAHSAGPFAPIRPFPPCHSPHSLHTIPTIPSIPSIPSIQRQVPPTLVGALTVTPRFFTETVSFVDGFVPMGAA
jgi:hypothetical protein